MGVYGGCKKPQLPSSLGSWGGTKTCLTSEPLNNIKYKQTACLGQPRKHVQAARLPGLRDLAWGTVLFRMKCL